MKSCDICARGTNVMQKKSHSQVKHKTSQKANIQNVKVEGGSIKLCSSCLKKLNKVEKDYKEQATKKKV